MVESEDRNTFPAEEPGDERKTGRYVIAIPWPFAVRSGALAGMWHATVDGQDLFDWAGYYAFQVARAQPSAAVRARLRSAAGTLRE